MASDAPNEMREDIPLKLGGRQKQWICCLSDDCFGGSRLVSTSFFVLSIAITFALLLQIYYGDYQVVPHGSVASDSRECSEIGTTILKKDGNAADAAIATAFCLAVVNPHVTGLDAEGQFMIYNHRTRELAQVVTFRRDLSSKVEFFPRMVIGLASIHLQYGRLSWGELIQPSINLARRGFLVPKNLVSAIKAANVQSLFGNLEAGQFIRMQRIANTLQSYADIPEADLSNYITLENTPMRSIALLNTFRSFNIYVPNAPSIGPQLLMNLQRIERFNFTQEETNRAAYYYRIAETTQQFYTDFNITNNFHEGTSSNVAVMDKDDNYVSLVTGLYQLFGSRELSKEGYILDEKNVPSIACSRIPLIVTNSNIVCGRRLILGANNVVTAVQVLSSLLIASHNVTSGVEFPRFNLVFNYTIGFEDDHQPSFPNEVIDYMETLGQLVHVKEPYSSCNVVEKIADMLNSHSDSRGGGISSRFR